MQLIRRDDFILRQSINPILVALGEAVLGRFIERMRESLECDFISADLLNRQTVQALDRELRDPKSLSDLTICELREKGSGWSHADKAPRTSQEGTAKATAAA